MNDRTRVERPSTRRARPPKLARWLGFTGLFLGVAACGSGGESAAETPPIASAPAAESNAVGSIELGLALGDSNIRAVSYSIIGNQFQTTGVIDVSRSTQIASEIGGIPFGTNYVVTLTAASADGTSTTCSGSASFDVTRPSPRERAGARHLQGAKGRRRDAGAAARPRFVCAVPRPARRRPGAPEARSREAQRELSRAQRSAHESRASRCSPDGISAKR